MITTTRLRSIATDSIPNGTKFVALYDDGSGAKLFMVDKDGMLFDGYGIDYGETPDCILMDFGYSHWIALPKTFKIWFEKKGNLK